MFQIPLETLMTKKVRCVSPKTKLRDLARLMAVNRYSCLVVTEKKVPLGIITERDLVKILAECPDEGPFTLNAAALMSSPVTTMHKTSTLLDAIAITRVRKIRHLPVVNVTGTIAGLITQSDLIQAYLHILEAQHEVIQRSVAERTRELNDANEHLMALSLEDPLLRIGNRRAMEVDLKHVHFAALRSNTSYSVLLIDIDHFKQYNDHYGHTKGDDILKKVIHFIQQSLRKSDRVFRYGGEEFLLLFPDTMIKDAQQLSRKLIRNIHDLKIPHLKSPFKRLTISGGVCSFLPDKNKDGLWEDVIKSADLALYKAKKKGRNQAAISRKQTTQKNAA